MNLREAAQQALEALELHLQWHESGCVYLEPAVTALRAALADDHIVAAAEMVEPNAWLVTSTDLDEFRHHAALAKHVLLAGRNSRAKDRVPLYAAPPRHRLLIEPENAS